MSELEKTSCPECGGAAYYESEEIVCENGCHLGDGAFLVTPGGSSVIEYVPTDDGDSDE